MEMFIIQLDTPDFDAQILVIVNLVEVIEVQAERVSVFADQEAWLVQDLVRVVQGVVVLDDAGWALEVVELVHWPLHAVVVEAAAAVGVSACDLDVVSSIVLDEILLVRQLLVAHKLAAMAIRQIFNFQMLQGVGHDFQLGGIARTAVDHEWV